MQRSSPTTSCPPPSCAPVISPATARRPVSRPDVTGTTSPGARHASAGRAPGVLLSARSITKRFGAVEALSGVDLDVPSGQVTALLGDNGAGKSTLIKTISGIWEPDAGHM